MGINNIVIFQNNINKLFLSLYFVQFVDMDTLKTI
jgi:hypothetical protein